MQSWETNGRFFERNKNGKTTRISKTVVTLLSKKRKRNRSEKSPEIAITQSILRPGISFFRRQISLVVFHGLLKSSHKKITEKYLQKIPTKYINKKIIADLDWLQHKLKVPGWTNDDRMYALRLMREYHVSVNGKPRDPKTVRFGLSSKKKQF